MMKLFPTIAVLAFGGALLAGCNPNKDQADPMSEEDQSAAPAAPADTAPAPDSATTPYDQPPPPDATTPTEPTEEPAPPPTG